MLVRSEVGDPACSQTKETDIDSACKLSRGAQTYDDCWHTRFPEGYSRHHSAGIPQIPCSHLRGRAAPSSVIYNPLGWEKTGRGGVIVRRQTRFVFAGYTFVFLDPWPAGWLLSDDCFVDFVDEQYFLFDVLHPGVRVALLVVE